MITLNKLLFGRRHCSSSRSWTPNDDFTSSGRATALNKCKWRGWRRAGQSNLAPHLVRWKLQPPVPAAEATREGGQSQPNPEPTSEEAGPAAGAWAGAEPGEDTHYLEFITTAVERRRGGGRVCVRHSSRPVLLPSCCRPVLPIDACTPLFPGQSPASIRRLLHSISLLLGETGRARWRRGVGGLGASSTWAERQIRVLHRSV